MYQEDKQRFQKRFIRGLRKNNRVLENNFLKMTKESSKSSRVKRATGKKMTAWLWHHNIIITSETIKSSQTTVVIIIITVTPLTQHLIWRDISHPSVITFLTAFFPNTNKTLHKTFSKSNIYIPQSYLGLDIFTSMLLTKRFVFIYIYIYCINSHLIWFLIRSLIHYGKKIQVIGSFLNKFWINVFFCLL